jgi:hypothetical protein
MFSRCYGCILGRCDARGSILGIVGRGAGLSPIARCDGTLVVKRNVAGRCCAGETRCDGELAGRARSAGLLWAIYPPSFYYSCWLMARTLMKIPIFIGFKPVV